MYALVLRSMDGGNSPDDVKIALVEHPNTNVDAGQFEGWEVMGIFPVYDSIETLQQQLGVGASAQRI